MSDYADVRSYGFQLKRESFNSLNQIDKLPQKDRAGGAAYLELLDIEVLTPDGPRMRVYGVDGAGADAPVTVTLPSLLSDTTFCIEGSSAVGTVTIAAAANVKLAGGASLVLGLYDTAYLYYSTEASAWLELSRSVNS